MKRSLFLLVTLAMTNMTLIAQTDTIYFNKQWEKCSSKHFEYYRIIHENESGFIINDYYSNGNLQMTFYCSSIHPEIIKDGPYIVYNKNGYKEKKGEFTNNKESGAWTFYEKKERDSTVATLNPDGTKHYSHMSKAVLKKQKEERIYTLADQMPSFPGGKIELNKFISREFKLSKEDKRNNIQGTFYISFVVNKKGELKDPQILRSLSNDCDKSAIEMISKMPNWIPGEIKGKKVKVKYNLPIAVK